MNVWKEYNCSCTCSSRGWRDLKLRRGINEIFASFLPLSFFHSPLPFSNMTTSESSRSSSQSRYELTKRRPSRNDSQWPSFTFWFSTFYFSWKNNKSDDSRSQTASTEQNDDRSKSCGKRNSGTGPEDSSHGNTDHGDRLEPLADTGPHLTDDLVYLISSLIVSLGRMSNAPVYILLTKLFLCIGTSCSSYSQKWRPFRRTPLHHLPLQGTPGDSTKTS